MKPEGGTKLNVAFLIESSPPFPSFGGVPARAGWFLGGESTPAMVILMHSPTTPSGFACHPSTGGEFFLSLSGFA